MFADSEESRTVDAAPTTGEVARLLLIGERVATFVHRQDQVSLFDDLLAVEVKVREVQKEGVLVRAWFLRSPSDRARESPRPGDGFPALSRKGSRWFVRRPAELRRFLAVDFQAFIATSMCPLGRIRGRTQVLLRHQVRIDVVVGNRAVLVGTRHAVDPKPAGRVVMAERAPQPRCLDQQLRTDIALELRRRSVVAWYRITASAMSALTWKAAVPAGQ